MYLNSKILQNSIVKYHYINYNIQSSEPLGSVSFNFYLINIGVAQQYQKYIRQNKVIFNIHIKFINPTILQYDCSIKIIQLHYTKHI